ncbi:T9SS type A sorting domain-containing protein [Candidatus Fermentibacteria bacterium]|nr:T9SS type A sorting domain-containing protein [Candidatus Fermentibacteria bacterium]
MMVLVYALLLGGLEFGPGMRIDEMIDPSVAFSDLASAGGGVLCAIWDGDDPKKIWSVASTDGGNTWQDQVEVNDESTAYPEQPSVAADTLGTFYAAWGDQRGPGPGVICFSKSTDHGLTWLEPNVIATDSGVESVAADIACSADGSHIVIAFNRIDERRIYCTCSDDGGATWSDDVPAGDEGTGSQFYASVHWMGDDNFICAWRDPRYPYLYASVSYDGGATWLHPNVGIPTDGNDPEGDDIKFCWAAPYVHVTWTTWYSIGSHAYFEVYYSRSDSTGVNWWPEPARVDSGGHSIYRDWGGIWSPDSRTVYVAWRQTERYEEEMYALCAASYDSGRTWGVPAIANNDKLRCHHCSFTGDRKTGSLYMIWHSAELWFSRGTDDTGIGSEPEQPAAPILSVSPNPCDASTTVHLLGAGGLLSDVRVRDIYGRLVCRVRATTEENRRLDTSSLPSGVYLITARHEGRSYNANAVVIH